MLRPIWDGLTEVALFVPGSVRENSQAPPNFFNLTFNRFSLSLKVKDVFFMYSLC